MGQLQALSDQLEQARSRYDASTAQLARFSATCRRTRTSFTSRSSNLKTSERVIAQRLVTLYTSDQSSTLEVILGATSLDDMINRINSVKSVTSLDGKVLGEVKSFRRTIKRNGTLLAQARVSQQQVVAERAAAKQSIASKISEQNRLLTLDQGPDRADHRRRSRAPAADGCGGAGAASRRSRQPRRLRPRRPSSASRRSLPIRPPSSRPRRSTRASSASRSHSSARRTCGAVPPRAASTARASSCGPMRRSASRCRTRPTRSTRWACRSRRTSSSPATSSSSTGVGHVGIYIGGGQFIEAPHTGGVVQISDLNAGWYAQTYVGARRIL